MGAMSNKELISISSWDELYREGAIVSCRIYESGGE